MTAASPAAGRLPLSALLSQALVAFTIEFDNAAELRIEHYTTRHGARTGGVWLTSMAMWLNCLRYVSDEPVTLGAVARLARTRTNLDGMRRWGYVTVEPGRDSPAYRARRPDLVLRATKRGMRAREIWEPLTGEIEQRWNDRFGAAEISRLRTALGQLADQFGPSLPDCMPMRGFALYNEGQSPGDALYRDAETEFGRDAGASGEDTAALPLPWLLARLLTAFALAYERRSKISLAVAANLLRLLDEREPVRVRDLPELTGVSKEAIAGATRLMGLADVTVTGSDPAGGRWKVTRLTPKGVRVRDAYADRTEFLEEGLGQRYGSEAVTSLRASLEQLIGTGGPGSPLFAGIEPGPGNWRTDLPPLQALPHFPLVSHRGGFPDGS